MGLFFHFSLTLGSNGARRLDGRQKRAWLRRCCPPYLAQATLVTAGYFFTNGSPCETLNDRSNSRIGIRIFRWQSVDSLSTDAGALRADGRTEAFQGFRSGYKLLPSVKMSAADELADLIPSWCSPFESDPISNMIDRSKLKLGNSLPGYRFKPGECIVNSRFVHEFRQGKCTQKELNDLKMLVVELGIDKSTEKGSYRFLYYCTAGGDKIPWN